MTDTTIPIEEARQQLHEIVRQSVPFEEKARDALDLATQCLGVETAYLSRIEQETGHWEVAITTDTTEGETPPNVNRDLQKTPGQEPVADNGVLALHDAPDQGWDDDPTLETTERHTYLGIPLILEEGPYGTLCFVADDRHSESFTESELQFADHLARLLERELERERVESELTNQTNLATVLNRVLRHNLRNDISVIRGYTEVLAEQLDRDPTAETVLTQIDELIELTEKARELEDVVSTSSEQQHTEIGALIEDVVQTVTQEYPDASISVEYDQEIIASVLQSFDRAVQELIENAVKHSGEDPVIEVTIERVSNGVEIQIADNGPGLPKEELLVLESGAETPLTHGSGLGLWMAHWIVTSQDGSIDPTVTNNGTTMTVTIPEKSTMGVQQQLTELTRSRDKYKTAFEEATDAITILNDDGRIMEANPAMGTVFGVESEELLGRSITEFLPESTLDMEWQDDLPTGGERETATVIDADGRERVLEYSATVDIIPGQHLFVTRDVTDRIEREQELELAETVFQNTQDALVLVDVVDEQEYRLNRVNDAFLEVTPYSHVNIIGLTPQELLGEEVGDDIQSQFQECVRSQQPVEFEQEVPADDGSRIWQVRLSPLMQDGEVTQLVAVMRNITERKERERRYNAIFNQTYQFTGLLDTDGRVLEGNETALEFGGFNREDVVGKPFWEVEWWQDEDTRQEVREAVDRAATGEFVRSEVTLHGDDDTVVIDFSIRPITDEQGNVTLLVPEGRNISERKEHEQELELAETVFENTQDALFVIDVTESGEFYVERVNEIYEELTGLSNEAIQGKSPREVVGDDIGSEIEAQYRECVERRETIEYPEEIPVDGEPRNWQTKVTPVVEDGHVVKLVGAMRDVTPA